MKSKNKNTGLPWYDEIACWIGSIFLLPIMLPLILAGIIFAIGMVIFDKINDGFGH